MKEKIISLLAKHTALKPEDLLNLIETPPDSSLGDFAFPCFSLAKELKKNPVEIAKELVSKIKPAEEIEKITANGPYINFFINPKEGAKKLIQEILEKRESYGIPKTSKKTSIIEFPSPNTNKPLHIGHLRNIVLGQAISRIFSTFEKKPIIANLNNDRGIHICKSMVAYEKYGKNTTPEKEKTKPDHFIGNWYVEFSKHPELDESAKECLLKWENKDKKTLLLWKKMNNWALNGFKDTYKKLGISFDKEYFESKIYKSGKEIILDAFKKGILSKNKEGAIYADLTKYGLGEKILLRADGTSIYVTQDIYLANLKQNDFNADKSIIITATEQNHHFQVLFKLLEILGFDWAKNSIHLSYGMVNLESGRMKSREGTVVDIDDLLDEMEKMALEEIESRYKDLSQKEKKSRAKAIVSSAIRYFFLKVERTKDIVFKPEESIKFEGDTGPYLLYSYARAKSILRKAKYKPQKSLDTTSINPHEKQLLLQMSRFQEIISSAYEKLAPEIIAHYAYQLSQSFNEFYHANPVIGSKEEKFRLALVDSFSQLLKNSLSLLNIDTIEKM